MDFLSHFVAVLCLLVSFIYYVLNREKAKTIIDPGRNSSRNEAPEPKGALPFIGHLHLLARPQPVARILAALADKYGPIFSLRLGNHRGVVVSSWEMVRDCYSTNDKVFITRPSMALCKYVYDHSMFALVPYGPYWRYARKIATVELFTHLRLQKLKHVRVSEVASSVKHLYLDRLCNISAVNMSEWFEELTFNITLRMLAGKRYSSDEGDDVEKEKFKEAVKRALYLGGLTPVSDCIPSLEWMDIGGHIKSMKKTAKDADKVIGKWLQEHIQRRKEYEDNAEDGDFMDVMLSTLKEDATLSDHRRDTIVKATVLVLIMTGTESTADTLIWALSLLLNHRQVLRKVQEELDTHVGRNRLVQESDITHLTYFQAVVKETLRLYPPGPLAGPREAMEDCYIGGYFVPKGTRLLTNLWKLHRDPRIWSEPLEFQPERWFGEEHADVNFRGQSYEYIPFSSGRRMCPAVSFGLQVVQQALASLLHGFDISTPMDQPVDMKEGLGISLPKVEPLRAILTPRLPSEMYQNL